MAVGITKYDTATDQCYILWSGVVRSGVVRSGVVWSCVVWSGVVRSGVVVVTHLQSICAVGAQIAS